MTALIVVTSGKPKSGKTFLSTNLALYLSNKGYPSGVVVAGGTFPVWGAGPCDGWETIAAGGGDPVAAMKRNLFGVDLALLQGVGNGYRKLSANNHEQVARSLRMLNGFAYLIVDVGSSPWPSALACCLTATELILVLTADSAALNNTFEWLIRLKKSGFKRPVNVILNQVRKPALAQVAYARFRDLAQKKLSIKINLWGTISYDSLAMQPRVMERPLTESLPQSRIVREIQNIGDRLLAEQPPENQTLTLDTFWVRFLEKLADLPRFEPQPEPDHSPHAPGPEEIIPELGEEEPETEITSQETAPSAEPVQQQAPGINEALLIRLCTHIEAISRELAALRHDLDKTSSPPQEEKPEPVKLDFEEFLALNR
jgi:MinD-like ATPase involved in chromosome partitioning or flagellar assembly